MTTASTSAVRSMPQLLTVPEVAEVTRTHRRTVDNWISRGLLPVKRAGGRVLILRSDLLKFLGIEEETPS